MADSGYDNSGNQPQSGDFDWMALLGDAISAQYSSKSKGKIDWREIERLMALDTRSNRTDRQGIFSGWEWDEDPETGRWTQTQTLQDGMRGSSDRLMDRANGLGMNPYTSPEQFGSMLDAKMANQMGQQGLLSDQPQLQRQFGNYANSREGMFPTGAGVEYPNGVDPETGERFFTNGGGNTMTSPLSEQGNEFGDRNQRDFQNGQTSRNHMNDIQRELEFRNRGGDSSRYGRDTDGKWSQGGTYEGWIKGAKKALSIGGAFGGLQGAALAAAINRYTPNSLKGDELNQYNPNFVGPVQYDPYSFLKPEDGQFVGPIDNGQNNPANQNTYNNNFTYGGRHDNRGGVNSRGEATRINRYGKYDPEKKWTRPPQGN
jgi:hypothetical protein